MSNIQKAFENKAKCGLRMAVGGFLDTVQEATPTSMFSGSGGSVGTSYSSPGSGGLRANQRNAGFSSGAGFTPGKLQQPVQPTSVGNALDNRIGMGTAIENSNLTMSEKGALGLGTTSADASALRRQTDALTTLRSAMPQQQLAMQQPEQEPFALAESGVVAAQAQADRMCKEYKVGCDTVRPPAAPAPVQQAAPAPVAKPQGIIGLLKGRPAQIDAASGYAKSGVVQGEGTRTSDSVPAVVGEGDEKQKLALSKGEGLLVVSNNTMDNPEAMEQIRQILADSNGGKEPKMPDQGLRAGVQKAAASGFFPAQQGYLAQAEAAKREVAGPPAPSARVLQPDEAAALKEKVLTGEVVGSMNRDDKSPQEISQGSVGNTFVADGAKPTLRSGAVSNMQPDPNVKYGTTMVDATQMQAPNGGGYITGAPQHANGLRRAIEVSPTAPKQRDPNGEYDVHGNNMAYTNQMKAQLAEMQRDRIKRTAAMPGATRGDMVALATQMRDDENAAQASRFKGEMALRGQEMGLRRDQLNFQNENMLADNQRANAAARTLRDKNTRTEVSEHLKTAAMDEDGKVNGPKLAFLERAVSQINDPNMDPDLLAQKKLGHAKALSWLDDAGQHWYSLEKAQDGFTMPDLVEEGDGFRDRTTNQTISKWRLKRAPADVQRGIYDMLEMQKAARTK